MNRLMLKSHVEPNPMDSSKMDEYKYWTDKKGIVHGEARVWRNTRVGMGFLGTGPYPSGINLELSIQRCTFPKGIKYE